VIVCVCAYMCMYVCTPLQCHTSLACVYLADARALNALFTKRSSPEYMCVCVCVCVRVCVCMCERETERVGEREKVSMCMSVSVYVCECK
jgi:hypothetical protein